MENVLIVAELFVLGLQILFLKEFLEDLFFVMHGRNGRTTIVPRNPPTTIVYTEIQKGESSFLAHFLGKYLIQ